MKIKLAFVAAALLVLSLFAYYSLRVRQLEKRHIDSAVKSTAALVTRFTELKSASGDDIRKEDTLKEFCAGAQKKNPSIAVIAVAEKNMTVRIAGKNPSLVPTRDIYDAILEDFARDRIVIGRDLPYLSRYYPGGSGAAASRRYYVFLNAVDDMRILSVYPHFIDTKIRTRMALEASLICIFSVLFWAAVSLVLDREKPDAAPKKDDPKPSGVADAVPSEVPSSGTDAYPEESIPINLDEIERTVTHGGNRPAREVERSASEGFKEYVVDLFRQLTSLYAPHSVALYVAHSKDFISKAFELKGESFITIDSPGFETMDMNGDIGAELGNASSMLLDGGKKLLIPLIYRDSFLGAVEIVGNGPFTGGDLPRVRALSDTILKNLNDYLVVNDIMIDRESGLQGKTALMLKYHEMARHAQAAPFGVLVISLYPGIGGLEPSLQSRLLRTMAPALSDILGERGECFRLDSMIAALLPGHEVSGTAELSRKISETLGKYRIKLDGDTVITLDPRVGWAHSREALTGTSLVEAAQRELLQQRSA